MEKSIFGRYYIKINNEHIDKKISFIDKFNFKNMKILDIGCANGIYKRDFIKNNEFYGIDNDRSLLSIAERKGYKTFNVDINFQKKLHFKNEEFDIVICFDILEHLINPISFLNEVNRILKKNGLLFISVPNSLNIISRINFLFGNPTDITDTNHFLKKPFSEHLHLITYKKIIQILEGYKYKVIYKDYYLPKKIRHKKLLKFQFLLNTANLLKLNFLFPGLFSFAFLFVCKKNV